MRDVPVLLAAHSAVDVTALTLCWLVTRKDGVLIVGTEEARDVLIETGPLAGRYLAGAGITGSSIRSSSDLAVDNLEVTGALPEPGDLMLVDLRGRDIEAGLLDDAEVVLFLVNHDSPSDGQLIIRFGNLGDISRTTDGNYKAELRGLSQRLRQTIIRTYGVTCDAELGDARCTFDLASVTANGIVTAVVDRSFFESGLTGISSTTDVFVGGLVTWLTGDNVGLQMEVKQDRWDAVLGNIQVYEPMPYDIQVGDTFTLSPGCDKLLATCRDTFDNLLNFRGHGVLVPGRNKVALFGEV